MNILSNIVSWWKIRRLRKRIAKIRDAIRRITVHRIYTESALPKPRNNKSLGRAVDKVMNLFFIEGPHAQIDDEWENLSVRIYEWLRNDATAKSDLSLYLRAWHLRFAISNDVGRTCFVAQKYLSFFKKPIVPLSITAISEEYSAIKERIKFAGHASRNSMPINQSINLRRIDIRLQDFALAAPMMSVVFFIAGYMHISIVYKYFGIDASQFFSLGDYLAGSIQQIHLSLIPIISCAIALILLHLAWDEKNQFIIWKRSISTWLRLLFIYVMLLSLLCTAYVRDPNVFWAIAPLSVVALGLIPIQLVALRFFNNPFPVFATVILLLIFFANILRQSHIVITNIEKEHEQNTFLVESTDHKFTNKEFAFIGGNERYIFLFGKNGNAEIIPMRNIKKITMLDSKPSGLLARASAFFLAR